MYDNAYNRDSSHKINNITQHMINHENFLTNTDTHDHQITTRLEGMCIRKKSCYGGSGYAAATVGDHGYAEDKTLGARVSAAGVSAVGVSAAGKRRRSKRDPAYLLRSQGSCSIRPYVACCGQDLKTGW